MNRRAEILQELVRYEKPTGPLMLELKTFGWDWLDEQPLLILKKENLLQIIDRFLAGDIDSDQLQEWAENLECREDVAFDPEYEKLIDDVFFRIATPIINERLTKETVKAMREELTQTEG